MARLWVWLREDIWEIRFRRYVALTLAAALVGLGVWGGMTAAKVDRSCAPGVVQPKDGDECVGVSSTAYAFGRARFTETVRAINRENHRLAPGSYVTVALLEPFTATDADNLADVLHELQGAYLAQYQANHDTTGLKPKIRLVLANPGATGASWRHTVDQLDRMAEGPDRLRAVTGVGLSTDNNKKAVAELTRRGIPVIGSSITADSLANGQDGKDPFPGLARVSPTNTDEARALASFAKVSAANAFLVYDRTGDPYTRTLQSSFEKMLKGARYEAQPFTPPADRSKEGSTANVFAQIANILCNTPKATNTVLFAGRHTQLRQFINALGTRGCSDRRFTVLTGDEGSYLAGDKDLDPAALKDPLLTVRYTALAHPDAWPKDGARTGGSAADAKVLQRLLADAAREPVGPIGQLSLDDGQLIIAYDAMRLAVRGIRGASPTGRIPALADVGLQWPQVKGAQLRVNGASGWICLDAHGNPYDKAVPIVELTHDSRARFVRIAWPDGKPPAAQCLPPS
ncbi:ABC transporter substrate-binding protein [Streptomyces sp. NPDC051920]|uniref:ABC transporter substrate-binding protein n=1 Tax=Streptomyces sp. NPDC051920 TaxID=3155523 RepID=UPI003417543C